MDEVIWVWSYESDSVHIVRSMVDHLALQAMEVVTGIFGRALKRSEMLGCHHAECASVGLGNGS